MKLSKNFFSFYFICGGTIIFDFALLGVNLQNRTLIFFIGIFTVILGIINHFFNKFTK